MKAVYSYIIAPWEQERQFSGFGTERDFVAAWALSTHLSKRRFDSTHLYADQGGREILEKAGITFDEYTTLDRSSRDERWWSMGKVEAYSKQTGPFLHIDFDVFMVDMDEKVYNAEVICQGVDILTDFNERCIELCREVGAILPDYVEHYIKEVRKDHVGHNTGIIGGTNPAAIVAYAKDALKFVNDNKLAWDIVLAKPPREIPCNIRELCVMVEQLFFSAKMHSLDQEITNYLVTPGHLLCSSPFYLHLLGTLKRDKELLGFLYALLEQKDPERYNEIITKYPI